MASFLVILWSVYRLCGEWSAGLVSRWRGSGWEPLNVANRKGEQLSEGTSCPWGWAGPLASCFSTLCAPWSKTKPASPSSLRNNRWRKQPSSASILFSLYSSFLTFFSMFISPSSSSSFSLLLFLLPVLFSTHLLFPPVLPPWIILSLYPPHSFLPCFFFVSSSHSYLSLLFCLSLNLLLSFLIFLYIFTRTVCVLYMCYMAFRW